MITLTDMTTTEMYCRMNIHMAADKYYRTIPYHSRIADFHNLTAWKFHNILDGYYPDQSRNWIKDNLGLVVYTGHRMTYC